MPLLLIISVTLFLLLPFLLLLILLALVFLPLIFLLVLPLLFVLLWIYFLFKILCIFTARFQEMKLMHRKKKKNNNNKSCKPSRDKEEIVDSGPWVLEKENKSLVEDGVKEIDEGSWQIVAPKSAKSNETKTFKEILCFWRSRERERGSASTG